MFQADAAARERGQGKTDFNILGGASAADLAPVPFPHLVRSPALPSELYQQLAAEFAPLSAILGDRVDKMGNVAARLPAFKVKDNPAISEAWRAFFAFHTSQAFWLEIVRVFGAEFRTRHPAMEAQVGRKLEEWNVGLRRIEDEADVRLDCQFVVNTPAERASSVKTAHIDKSNTIFSMLWYFRDPEDDSTGGDLELFAWKRAPRFLLPRRTILPRDLDKRGVVRYAPNTMVAFANSTDAVHGVTVRSPTRIPRRYINFVATTRFKVFATPELTRMERFLHWPQMRRMEVRALQGDQY
ncbi:MAG TPA: 2OG-Fe(II) oxygenase [Candidatus Cybelea sp.]|nr:2OG-Fe(II) oxygenase [Candidatus Cybelea sp.]